MLTKDLLRVSRAGGNYRPRFATAADRDLAARLLGVYQGHVGESLAALDEGTEAIERDTEDFKLVRGFAKLLDRDTTVETRSPVAPDRARQVAFEAAEAVGVVTEADRETALSRAGDRLDVTASAVEQSLYADRPDRQMVVDFDPRFTPEELVAQYNLSLAQTALFDATEVRARSSDPKGLISAVKRLGLMYEIRLPEGEASSKNPDLSRRTVVVTGPDALFRSTRRYGTAFARLLRTLVGTGTWELEATIDDRGTERTLGLSDADPLRPPGVDPITDLGFDSQVEADFATRFESLGLDWDLRREPDVLAAGTRAMVPDFAFDYCHADFRVYFEVMGFWTPEYVEKKLDQLATVEEITLLVAVDEDLGVGEAVAARDHRVVTYSGRVRVKAVRDALREFETDLVARNAAALPDELRPDEDVCPLSTLADRHEVSVDALSDKRFPDHKMVGRTLVRPRVLDALSEQLEPGITLADAKARLDEYGLDDASATLSTLGYRVEWEGLSGGRLRRRNPGDDEG